MPHSIIISTDGALKNCAAHRGRQALGRRGQVLGGQGEGGRFRGVGEAGHHCRTTGTTAIAVNAGLVLGGGGNVEWVQVSEILWKVCFVS